MTDTPKGVVYTLTVLDDDADHTRFIERILDKADITVVEVTRSEEKIDLDPEEWG